MSPYRGGEKTGAKIFTICVPGLRHAQQENPCQDYVYTERQDNLVAACVCDGAGAFQHSGSAAETISHFLCTYLLANSTELLRGSERANKYLWRDKLAEQIETKLATLSREHRLPRSELATTIVAAAMDHRSGQLLTVHLGDGTVFRITDSGCEEISYPENGFYRHLTYLTGNCDLKVHLRVDVHLLHKGERLLLISDGIQDRFNKLMQGASSHEFFADGLSILQNSIVEDPPSDDASAVLIIF